MLHQNKRTKESRSDEWWTDQKLYNELCKKYDFYPEIDVAATEANRLCKFYFSKEENALTRNWKIGKKKRKCWLNPPNKIIRLFIEKAYEQFASFGIKTMMIVPLNVQSSCSWWTNVQIPMERGEKILVRPIHKRRKFLFKGTDRGTSINGYCVIIFGRKKLNRRYNNS